MSDSTQQKNLPTTNILVNRFFMSLNEKANKENGKKMLQQFYEQQTASNDSLNFSEAEMHTGLLLLLWAKVDQVMNEFWIIAMFPMVIKRR